MNLLDLFSKHKARRDSEQQEAVREDTVGPPRRGADPSAALLAVPQSPLTPTRVADAQTAALDDNPGDRKYAQPVDCAFSMDEAGQTLHRLWGQYTSSDNDSAHIRYCEFADSFLQLYEPILQTQCSRPLAKTEEPVVAQPLRLQDTTGHPRDLVVHVAKSLLSFLDIQSDILGVGTAAGDVVINVQAFFAQSDEASKTDLISLWKLRQQFVRTLRCLSVLVFWRHNRRVLRRSLGPEFIQIIVELLGSLVSKLEELGVQWAEDDLSPAKTAMLQEDTSFVTSAVLALQYIIISSVNSFQAIRQSQNVGSLPLQPWGLAGCAALGFDVYDLPMFSRMLSEIERRAAAISGDPQQLWLVMLEVRRELLDDCGKNKNSAFATAVAEVHAELQRIRADPMHPKDQQPVPSAEQLLQVLDDHRKIMMAENWAGLLLRAGAVKTLLSFLRKSVPLMKSINTKLHAVDGRTALYHNVVDEAAATAHHSVSMAHNSCSLLQNEALYAMQALMLSEGSAARATFHMCDGPSITAYILSCRHYIIEPCQAENESSQAETHIAESLQFGRALTCLRIAELCLLIPGEDDEIRQAAKDCQVIFEQLGGLLDWMMRCMVTPTIPANSSIVVECDFPSECQAPSPIVREVWPWDTERYHQPYDNFLNQEPSPLNYHLCKPGDDNSNSTALDTELRTNSRDQRFAEALSSPLRAIAVSKSSLLEHVSRAGCPWFAAGRCGRAWTALFDTIFNACKAHRGAVHDTRRAPAAAAHSASHSWDLLRQVLFSVGNFFLRMDNPDMEPHGRLSDYTRPPLDCQAASSNPSFLQYHMLIFVARCLRVAPTETIWICRQMRMWELFLSKHFMLGGKLSTERICQTSLQRMRHSESKQHLLSEDVDVSKAAEQPEADDSQPQTFGMRPNPSMRKLRWQPAQPTPEDLVALSWMMTRDGIMDLLMMVIEATLVPPTSHFVQGPQHEMRHAIDLLSESSPDTVIIQVCAWLAILLNDRRRAEAFSTLHKQQAMSNAMVVCRTQLHDLGLTTFNLSSAATQNAVLTERSRPFMWAARVSVISLVMLLLQDEGEACLELFLVPTQRRVFEKEDNLQRMFAPVEQVSSEEQVHAMEGASEGSFSSSARTPSRPAAMSFGGSVDMEPPEPPPEQFGAEHATVSFLLMDPRCRHPALFILTEVLHLCAFRQLQELQPNSEHVFTIRSANKKAGGSRTLRRAVSAPTPNLTSTNASHVNLTALAIVSGLLDHLSVSMKLPSWCKGFHGAMCILRWITSMLLDPDKRFLIRYHQALCRKSRLIVELQAFVTTATLKYRKVVRSTLHKSTSKTALNLQEHMESESATKPAAVRRIDSVPETTAVAAPEDAFNEVDETDDDHQSSASGAREPKQKEAVSPSPTNLVPVWPKEDKRALVRQVLATFAALMLDNDANKAEFKDVMQSRKRSKSRLTSRGGTLKTTFAPYHDLKRVILQVDPSPTLETFLVLLNMIVDADHFNPHHLLSKAIPPDAPLFTDQFDTPKVHSTEIIPLVFYLLPHASSELQRNLLFTFEQLARAHSNHSVLTFMQPSLVDLVLDLIPISTDQTLDTVTRLLKIIGTHSISVAQLKRIFRVMQSKGEFRPQYSWRLLDALRGMVMNEEHEEGQRACFLFEGHKSGLKLPVMPRWPASKGYTFYTWLRIERQSKRHTVHTTRVRGVDIADEGPLPYAGPTEEGRFIQSRPYILALRNSNGLGIDLYLRSCSRDEFVLAIESHKGEHQPPTLVELTSAVLRPGRWYFVAVSHSSGTFRAKSEVTLMVNDKTVTEYLSFPKFPGPVQHGFVGECVSEWMETKYITTFSGQMGAIYFFDEALSIQQLTGVYHLGAGYTYSFESPTIDRRDVLHNLSPENRQAVAAALDGFLTQHIMLAYNPSVYEGDCFLDNTPEKNAIRWKSGGGMLTTDSDDAALNAAGHMHAKRLPGTFEYIFRDVRDALDCLGGIKVLFPLFAQFDQPVQLPDGTVDYSVDRELNVKVLDLLNALLRESSENERILDKYGGFAIVGYFLERVSPLHMSQEALDSIVELIDRVAWKPAFQDSVVVHLLANFKLWVFTPVAVQHAVFDALRRLTVDRSYGPQRMRSAVGTQRLFDILNLFYWYEAPKVEENVPVTRSRPTSQADALEKPGASAVGQERSSDSSGGRKLASVYTASRWIHPATGEMVGQKPKGKDLIELRGRVFDIILTLITEGNGVRPDDIQALMGFLVHAPDALSKIEAMQVLLRLLRDPTHSARTLASLSICNGAHIILGLCSHAWAKVRLYAQVTFCRIVYRATTMRAMPSFPVEILNSDLAHTHMVVTPVSFNTAAGVETPKAPQASPTYTEPSRGRKSLVAPSSSNAGDTEHSTKPTFRDALLAIEDMEVWNALGLHPTRFQAIMMATKVKLLEAIKADFLANATVERQLELAVVAMQRLMLGEAADHMIDEIENLFGEGSGESAAADLVPEESVSSVHMLEQLQLPVPGEEADEGAFGVCNAYICIPAMFPVLMRFLANDLLSPALRLKVLVTVKAFLVNPHNCDVILALDCWQDSVLYLLASCHRRLAEMKGGEGEAHEKAMVKEQGVIDTALRMICDLQLHAVRYGAPNPSSKTFSAEESRAMSNLMYEDRLNFLGQVLQNRRRVGVTVLRETMSYVRYYGEQGELPVFATGLDLLQQTVDILRREEESQQKGRYKPLNELDLRGRLLQLNIWLVAAVILEFLAVPPLQKQLNTSKHRRPTSHVPSPALQRIRNERVHSIDSEAELEVLPEDSVLRESQGSFDVDLPDTDGFNFDGAVSSTDERPSNDTDVSSVVIEEYFTEDPKHPKVQQTRYMRRSHSVGDKLPTLHTPRAIPVHSIPEDQPTFTGSSPPIGVADIGPHAPVTAPPKAVRSSSAKPQVEPPVSNIFFPETMFKPVWRLLDSLIGLLGPTGNTPAWLSPTRSSILARARLSPKLGHRKEPSFGDVMTTTERSPLPRLNSSRALQATPRTKTTLTAVTGNVPWIIVRCLISVFSQGGVNASLFAEAESEMESSGRGEVSIPLQALQRVTVLLTALHENEFEHYDFEVLYVLGVVIRTLACTQLPSQSMWVQGALQFVIRLLRNHGDEVKELIEAYRVSVAHPSEETSKLASSTMLSSLMDKIFSKRKKDSGLKDERGSDLVVLETIASADDADAGTLALQAIRLSLGEGFTELSWDEWFAAMRPIMDEGKRLEQACLTARLTELGLHRHAQEVGIQLQSKRARIFRLGERMQDLVFTITTEFQRSETSRIWSVISASESLTRRCARQWGRILFELANERGAWGYGANEETQIFWMLDSVEDSMRRRMRLVRNQYGSRHAMASMLTRGDVPVATKADAAATAPVDANSPAGLAGDAADHTAHGLWKDLNKYQSNTQSKTAEEERDMHDDLDESKESKGPQDRRDEDAPRALEHIASAAQMQDSKRRVLFSSSCEIIAPFVSTPGLLEVTKDKIYFIRTDGEASHQPEEGEEWTWVLQPASSAVIPTSEIRDCACRHYQLRYVAVELFLTNRTTIFINLETQAKMKAFVAVLRNLVRPQFLSPAFGRSPKTVLRYAVAPSGTQITQAWVQREITNFEYIMALNTIAGRTFNDLAQYPVFPWVLANYATKHLDLRDPSNFRDLRYPMGAQKESQREMFRDKYQQLEQQYREAQEMAEEGFGGVQDQWPPFHYGTHYSTAGFVLWYLIRLEPFTSLHIHLQDGRFDKPDRLFDSIAATYNGCITNASDVKELIPEMFFLPEALMNTNKLDLGTTQSGQQLGDVHLPPWAKDAMDFVFIMREALESEYVSRNLHHWIDLVFGYKQRPPSLGGDQAAVDACNVFFYLTYEGAVDLEKMREDDRALYETTIKQIDNFGQTPVQLFTTRHPARAPLDQADIIWPIASIVPGVHTIPKGDPMPEKPNRILTFSPVRVSTSPILLIAEVPNAERLVTVDAGRVFGYHYWQGLSPDVVPPFKLRVDAAALELSQGPNAESSLFRLPTYGGGANTRDRRVGVPFAPQGLTSKMHGHIADLHHAKSHEPSDSDVSSARAQSASRSRKQSKMPSHSGTMKPSRNSAALRSPSDMYSSRLFAVHEEWRLLFSCGHWDQSFKVTSLDSGKLLQSVTHHRDVVTCLALAQDMGRHWLITGSRDCTVVVWEISPDKDAPVPPTPVHVLYGHDDAVNCVAVLAELDLIVSGSDDGTVIVYTLREGQYVQSITTRSRNEGGSSTTPTKDAAHPPHSFHDEVTSFARTRIHWVGLSRQGYLCSYSNDDTTLCTYTINGRFLARRDANEQLHAFTFSEDGNVLLTGGQKGEVVFYWVRTLELADNAQRKGFVAVLNGAMAPSEGGSEGSASTSQVANNSQPFGAPIRALRLTRLERHLLVGLQNGMLYILAQDSDYLRQRLQKKLVEIGIL